MEPRPRRFADVGMDDAEKSFDLGEPATDNEIEEILSLISDDEQEEKQ